MSNSPSDSIKPLPVIGLLALAMTCFIGTMTETLPAGLLPQMSTGLGVSEALAGQTVTIYALGSVLAAVPLTIATRGWSRRQVLLTTIVGFCIFNTITAFSENYLLTMGARFFAGIAAGLAWSLIAGYARKMVPVYQQGRALAVAMIGTPVALSIGLPFGTWLGSLIGWRGTYAMISVLSVVLIVWVLLKVPDYPGQSRADRLSLREIVTTPGVTAVLAVIVAWMLAHNMLYTYIAPFVVPAGLASHVDLILLVFGLTAILGIWIIGLIVDRWLRKSVLFSLGGFALTAVLLAAYGTNPIVAFVGVGLWGLTFGGAATLLQTALADSAGDGVDVAQAMCVAVWNLAIAGGGFFGGVLLETYGVASLPWAVLIITLVGLGVVSGSYRHAFKAGHRHSSATVCKE